MLVGRLLLVAIASIGLSACGPAGSTPSPSSTSAEPSSAAPSSASTPAASGAAGDPAAIGLRFVQALAAGDTATAEAMEDDTMRAAAPAAALAAIWGQITGQLGPFASTGDATTTSKPPFTVVTVPATFASGSLPLLVTVSGDGKVSGLHTGAAVPNGSAGASSAPSAPSASPAAYVHADKFTERDITVGSAPWALPGTLSMPTGSGPFPAVVLLAGSGPEDRDETIGPNAPLRDLAWGLASSGIAVLRYDKRTKVHAAEMAADVTNVTVKEETMDDAVAAIDLLRQTPGVDPDRVVLAGHSLGGFLAPRIAAEAPGKLAGIALLEANSSPLAKLIVDQYAYLASPDGGSDPQAAAQLDTIQTQAALAESPSLSPSTPASSLPLGVPAAYWLDLRSYSPTATAHGLSIPMFISQGGRDYQVPPSELPAWRAALAGRDDVAIREYPALNHLLIDGSGPSRPAEYAVPGHVAPELVADLAAWIQALR